VSRALEQRTSSCQHISNGIWETELWRLENVLPMLRALKHRHESEKVQSIQGLWLSSYHGKDHAGEPSFWYCGLFFSHCIRHGGYQRLLYSNKIILHQ
jgi:hypothetical protein